MDKFKANKFKAFKNFATGKSQYPVISVCPVCQNDLVVEKLHCHHCDTGIDGNFTLSKFNYLDTEQLYFIEVFVKNRGNIKAIEKEMDLSYPTIKKLLDDVIAGLGYKPESNDEPSQAKEKEKEPEGPKISKLDILDQINNAELSVDAALELIKKLKL